MAATDFRQALDGNEIVFVNRASTYAVGVADALPLAAVFALEDGAEVDALTRALGVTVRTALTSDTPRILAPDEEIERVVPSLEQDLHEVIKAKPLQTWLWCPRPCQTAWDFATANGLGNLCPEPVSTWKLQDKRRGLAGVAQLGLPVPQGEWLQPCQTSFGALASRLGLPFVAQLPIGVAGAGTAIVGTEKEWQFICSKADRDPLWITPYLGDTSVNVNGIVCGSGVFVGWPSVQLTGMSICNARPAAYCGNDYAAARALSATEHMRIHEQTARVGEWLAAEGYQGVFGMDLVRGPSGDFHPVDLNPRWQGSTALLAQGESAANAIPIAALAAADQMGLLNREEIQRRAERRPEVDASFFILRAPGHPVRCHAAMKAGVYSTDTLPAKLRFVREGFHLRDLRSESEVLLGGGMPAQGQLLMPGAMLMRVTKQGPVLEPDLRSYRPWVHTVAKAIYAACQLEPATVG